ncbi:hypothetical protein BTR25_23910 [Bacillus sp. MRMR6]|nr:hypothetical protein BTR25_23910 [Bacillus sp. MRMR6]
MAAQIKPINIITTTIKGVNITSGKNPQTKGKYEIQKWSRLQLATLMSAEYSHSFQLIYKDICTNSKIIIPGIIHKRPKECLIQENTFKESTFNGKANATSVLSLT